MVLRLCNHAYAHEIHSRVVLFCWCLCDTYILHRSQLLLWLKLGSGGEHLHASSFHLHGCPLSLLCSPPSLLLLYWVVTSSSLAATGSQLLWRCKLLLASEGENSQSVTRQLLHTTAWLFYDTPWPSAAIPQTREKNQSLHPQMIFPTTVLGMLKLANTFVTWLLWKL